MSRTDLAKTSGASPPARRSPVGERVLHGDCLSLIPTFATNSISAVITSPPYAQQRATTYGGIAEADYPTWAVKWANALRPKLLPDASLIVNVQAHIRNGQLSDYVLRTRLALRAAGW